MEKKKDVKSESPTLMDQWRQDYNKEFYRYSDNYDELYNSKVRFSQHYHTYLVWQATSNTVWTLTADSGLSW